MPIDKNDLLFKLTNQVSVEAIKRVFDKYPSNAFTQVELRQRFKCGANILKVNINQLLKDKYIMKFTLNGKTAHNVSKYYYLKYDEEFLNKVELSN